MFESEDGQYFLISVALSQRACLPPISTPEEPAHNCPLCITSICINCNIFLESVCALAVLSLLCPTENPVVPSVCAQLAPVADTGAGPMHRDVARTRSFHLARAKTNSIKLLELVLHHKRCAALTCPVLAGLQVRNCMCWLSDTMCDLHS